MYGSIFGVGLSVIQFGSWWWMCTCEIPSVLGLSYQVTLHSQRRTLLANCPHKAETVNSQARPVTMCLQVGACVSVQADSVECCSHGNGAVDPAVPWSDGKGVLPVSMDRSVLLLEHLDSVYTCICIFPTQSPSHSALYRLCD